MMETRRAGDGEVGRTGGGGVKETSGGGLDGATVAAVLAAGIGAFAMGLFVLLNEAGIYSAPGIYGPAGGVSGRTTFAMVVWLISWAVLHGRWKGRPVQPGGAFVATVVLIVLGLLATFPPLWGIF